MLDKFEGRAHEFAENEKESQRQYWQKRSAELRREADARNAAEAGLLDDAMKRSTQWRDR